MNTLKRNALKRPAAGTPGVAAKRRRDKIEEKELELMDCQRIFDQLKQKKSLNSRDFVSWFQTNPSKRVDPQYYKVIQNPLNFYRIELKIKNGDYDSKAEFMKDLKTLTSNVKEYYEKSSDQYRVALELEQFLETLNDNNVKDTASPAESTAGKDSNSDEFFTPEAIEDILTSVLDLSDTTNSRILSPPFRVLQTREEFPIYYERVHEPIDLKTIAERARAKYYTSFSGLEEDIQLLCSNAKIFNEPKSVIARDANTIFRFFLKKRKQAESGALKTLNKKRIEYNREMIDALIAQSAAADTYTDYSEDSEEDESTEKMGDPLWKLYWTIRSKEDNDDKEVNYADGFLELPRRSYYPDYYQEIKKPVSLFMVNKKLKCKEYKCFEDLVCDLVQIFDNACIYNADNSDLFKKAAVLRALTLKTAHEIMPEVDLTKFEAKKKRGPTDSAHKNQLTPASPKRVRPLVESVRNSPKVPVSETTSSTRTSVLRTSREPRLTESDASSDEFQKPARRRRSLKIPISTGFTPNFTQRKGKPGRKSMDERQFKYRSELFRIWKYVHDYREDDYWPIGAFMKLPSRSSYPDYYNVISNPIDMSIIRSRIENNQYDSSSQLLQDFKVMFANCRAYNLETSRLYNDSKRLESMVVSFHNLMENAPLISPLTARYSGTNGRVNGVRNRRSSQPRRSTRNRSPSEDDDEDEDDDEEYEFEDSNSQGNETIRPPPLVYQYGYGAYPPFAGYQNYPPHIAMNSGFDPLTTQQQQQQQGAPLLPSQYPIPMSVPPPQPLSPTPNQTSHSPPPVNRHRKGSDVDTEEMWSIFLRLRDYTVDGRKLSQLFIKLPSKSDYPDYYDIIAKPIDFETVKKRIKTNRYHSTFELIQDFELMFRNACQFNETDSELYKDAVSLSVVLANARRDYLRDREDVPVVSAELRAMFLSIFAQVLGKVRPDDVYYSSSIIHDLPAALTEAQVPEADWPFSLEQIKLNIELGRYRRLDKFQQDMFALLETARLYSTTTSDLYKDATELQYTFVCERDKYCKDQLSSTAFQVTEADLRSRIEKETMEKKAEESPDSTIDKEANNDEDEKETSFEDRCEDGPTFLDVARIDAVSHEDADGRTFYYQLVSNDKAYTLGEDVLLFEPENSNYSIMRIDRLWKEADGTARFSGGTFVRAFDSTSTAQRHYGDREVFAVVQPDQTRNVQNIVSKCCVLTTASITSNLGDCSLFTYQQADSEDNLKPVRVENASVADSFKQYSLPPEVPGPEIFRFATPLTMEQIVASFVRKNEQNNDIEMDLDDENEDEDIEAPSTPTSHDKQWLATQPKLSVKSKSGYILFSAEVRKRVMADNPDAPFGEISKIVGIEWKRLSDEQKKQYESRAEFIANERAKAEQEAPNVQTQPLNSNQCRVWICKWTCCEFMCDQADGLYDHLVHHHVAQIPDSTQQFLCFWGSCARSRKEGKNFPSMSRLLRHLKEKHMPTAVKIILLSQRVRNFYRYIAPTTENGQGQLLLFPFGLNPNQVPPALQASYPPTPQTSTAHLQNGDSLRQNGNHEPPSTVTTSAVMPSTFVSTAAFMPPFVNPSLPQVSSQPGSSQQPTSSYTTNGFPNVSTSQTQHHPQTQQPQLFADPGRTVITCNRNIEPVFIPPPNSVPVRRALHTEAYIKYVESLSSDQYTVSKYDQALKMSKGNNSGNPVITRFGPYQWVKNAKKPSGTSATDDEVVTGLWNLRGRMMESALGIMTDYNGPL